MSLTDYEWNQAKGHLIHMGMCYSGQYIVSSSKKEKAIWQDVIWPLTRRYYAGERTQELHKAIMAIGEDD